MNIIKLLTLGKVKRNKKSPDKDVAYLCKLIRDGEYFRKTGELTVMVKRKNDVFMYLSGRQEWGYSHFTAKNIENWIVFKVNAEKPFPKIITEEG